MITHERLTEILQEEIEKFQSIGITFKQVPKISKTFPKFEDSYAYATYRTYLIQISYYYLTAPEDLIRATIAHELVHLCDQAYEDGHGAKFRAVCRKFNDVFPGYDLKRLGIQTTDDSLFNLHRAVFSSDPLSYNYRVSCPQCHNVWYYKRNCRSVHDASNYICHCGCQNLQVRDLNLNMVI